VTESTADAAEVEALLLELGVALTMTGDAVSEVQGHLGAIASAYGYDNARVSVLPTLLIVALLPRKPASIRTIDSFHQLRLDQATEVIHAARAAEAREVGPAEALARLRGALTMPPRFGTLAFVASHAVLTLGLGLVIRPAPVDLALYLLLGALVGAMSAWVLGRGGSGGYLLPLVAAALVSAIAFVAHGGNEAASLRLTIPPLVTFLPGALLTMATVDLAFGETVTGASRFVAGLLQLALLGIAIVIGAELVGNPHTGPVAGHSSDVLGDWAPWVGVAIFGIGIFVHNSGPRRALPWLLIVLFAAWAGQVGGKYLVDATLSGFVGGLVMVPVAHLIAHVPAAPPAHVMFLPAFWLLVPGTIGLIGVTELVGENSREGSQHFTDALVSIPSVALGILAGTLVVRGMRVARRRRVPQRAG
jgi:uncharacterized membrane protein YjjP (DUF1212 family)/uncharacterized membrane protein YjjB (DUF3815 family)